MSKGKQQPQQQQHLPKKKKGQPPPVDRLLVPAIGIALAVVGWQFFYGIFNNGIARVSMLDQDALRKVVYGESSDQPHVVLCHAEDSSAPLSSVFQDAYKEGKSPAVFKVVDCNAVLPTEGKSIAEHWKINLQQRPTIFVSGGSVGPPQQIPEKNLKTGSMLLKYLRGKFEKRAAKIETTQDLRNKCLDKNVCGLLLKGGKKASNQIKEAMDKLLKEYPDVAFASVDSSVLYTLHLEEYLPEFVKDQARFVVFQKVSGSMTAGDSRLITSMAAAEFATYGPMSNTVAAVLQKTASLTKLPTLPQIKTRTKKLEEAERAKRVRKADQKRRQAEGGSSSSSSSSSSRDSSTESDSIKEERRRERERRRAEHYATHNVKPKTPEELAEMERKRRERMEEEAAKWNMAPEDAPTQGDGDGYDMFDEDYEYDYESTVVMEDVDGQQETDEDIIDLD